MIDKKTIEQFQKELSSKSPTPGGGVVAALAASFSASLIEMVCNLTRSDSILGPAKRAREIKKRLAALADEDAKAFDSVMKAYKLGKENSKRKETIKKTLKHAIEVPMEVRRLAQELEKIGYRVSKIGNKNAVSDAKTAIHLAHAASKSALENVVINKKALAKLSG